MIDLRLWWNIKDIFDSLADDFFFEGNLADD